MTIAMEIHALYNYAVAHADSTFASISIPSYVVSSHLLVLVALADCPSGASHWSIPLL